jgi:lipopolysaccharide/colanic/teichoic acid biosynthesis glycosyltransferase
MRRKVGAVGSRRRSIAVRSWVAHALLVASAFGVPLLVAAVQARARSKVAVSDRFDSVLVPLLLIGLVNYVMAVMGGLPDLYTRFRTRLLASMLAPIAASLVALSWAVLIESTVLARSIFFVTPLVLAPCYLVAAAVANRGAFTTSREHLAIVGTAAEFEAISDDVASLSRLGARYLDVGRFVEELPSMSGAAPDILVLCKSAREAPEVLACAERLHVSGTKVRTLVDFYEEWLGKLPLQELELTALFTDIAEIHSPIYLRAKRATDLLCGLVLLVPLVPVCAAALIANALASRGPLLFRQPRVGRNGEVFSIYKLRTMTPSSSEAGEWTAENDPRITVVGRVLRRTHLDELPQALNILRGELSVVGPRPEQVHYVQKLEASIPYYNLRHSVRPGLTGWAQVMYPYGANEHDALQKLQFELYYIRHQRFVLDVQVMVRTVRNLVLGTGR